jgi:hypothetical protein
MIVARVAAAARPDLRPDRRLDSGDRAILAALILRLPKRLRSHRLVTRATIVASTRRLVAKRRIHQSRTGRRRCPDSCCADRMAHHPEPVVGHMRIKGELRKLGHQDAAWTIRRIFKRTPIPGAPTRRSDVSWREFLRAQASRAPAVDFFHVDTVVL